MVGAVLAVAVGIVLVVVGYGGPSDFDEEVADEVQDTTPPETSPESGLPVPSADVAVATFEFLEGDGAVLLTMHGRAVEVLEGTLEPSECNTVAEALNSDAAADAVLDVLRVQGVEVRLDARAAAVDRNDELIAHGVDREPVGAG